MNSGFVYSTGLIQYFFIFFFHSIQILFVTFDITLHPLLWIYDIWKEAQILPCNFHKYQISEKVFWMVLKYLEKVLSMSERATLEPLETLQCAAPYPCLRGNPPLTSGGKWRSPVRRFSLLRWGIPRTTSVTPLWEDIFKNSWKNPIMLSAPSPLYLFTVANFVAKKISNSYEIQGEVLQIMCTHHLLSEGQPCVALPHSSTNPILPSKLYPKF